MSVSKLVIEVEHELEESQNQRDARIEKLWHQLDPSSAGELDLKGLQKAFRRIDHPMKNADDMLKQIVREVDSSGDGKIQYEEFRAFVSKAERQLFVLFTAIDGDGNGKIDMRELQTAFKSAGLSVSSRRLSEFFNDMDLNNDGYVSFNEWRYVYTQQPVLSDTLPEMPLPKEPKKPITHEPKRPITQEPQRINPSPSCHHPLTACPPATFCCLCQPVTIARGFRRCCLSTTRWLMLHQRETHL
jgi:Ca2+-binding EF-hand superfamily protein